MEEENNNNNHHNDNFICTVLNQSQMRLKALLQLERTNKDPGASKMQHVSYVVCLKYFTVKSVYLHPLSSRGKFYQCFKAKESVIADNVVANLCFLSFNYYGCVIYNHFFRIYSMY